jgi:signal transduction histidine kinase
VIFIKIYRRLVSRFIFHLILIFFGLVISVISSSFLIQYWITNQHGSSVDFEYQIRFYILLLLCICGTTLGIGYVFAKTLGFPLLHLLTWVKNLSQGIYEEPTNQWGVPNSQTKDGRIKRPFRIYTEVIEAFQILTKTLIRQRKDQVELEQTREDWMTGISHDLKTPLTTAKGYTELLLSDNYTWNEKESKRFVEIMKERMIYMEELIEDFHLTFQLENNAYLKNIRKTNIVDILRQSIVDLSNQYHLEGCQPINFYPDQEIMYCLIDQKLLKRAFDNLIGNAIKHNPSDTSIIVSITTNEAVNAQHSIIITIKDNGIGMDETTKKQLFDRYYRGKDSGKDQIGSGLGMNIAKKIIQSHRGTIAIESEKDRGTKLTIHLPCRS